MNSNYFEYSRKEIEPLLPAQVVKVLEIGCGNGNTLMWLKDIKDCQWIGGVEIDSNAADKARDSLNLLLEGNIEELDLPIEEGSLDLILCLDVLEHLVDPWEMVKRLKSLLRDGGSIIASIPNIRHKDALFPLLFKERWDYVDAGILDRTHLRFFVRNTAIELIESSGLKVDKVEVTGLGKSVKSKLINSKMPGFIRSLFEKQYLIRGVKSD